MKIFNRSLALSLLALCSLAFAKSKSKITGFELVSTTNVGYPQNELPTQVLINGQPNPCYFQGEIFHRISTIHHGSAVEPSIAVNPKNPRNIVACWQQDRRNNGGSLEGGIAYTFNGGKTWNRTEVPLQLCSGGISQTTSDVWLSFSCDGILYLNSLNVNNTASSETVNQMAINVASSKDGGRTWSVPIAVATSNFVPSFGGTTGFTNPFLDKNSVTADPNYRKNAYITFDSYTPANGDTSETFFSRTTDGGETWSEAVISYDPFTDLCAQGLSTCDPDFLSVQSGVTPDSGTSTAFNVITVSPEANPGDRKWKKDTWGNDANKAKRFTGNLLNFIWRQYPTATATGVQAAGEIFNFFGLITFFFYPSDVAVVSSQTQGSAWNGTATVVVPNTDFAGNAGAVYIAPRVFTGGYNYDADGNPASGNGPLLRTADVSPEPAVNPKNGFLYTVYCTGQFRDDFLPQIGLTTSRDGGHTWSERVRINQMPQDAPNPQAFTPFVAVTEDGYVGVLYSDFRNDPVAVPNNSPETLTDTWLAIYKEVAGPGSTGIGLDFVQEIRLSATSYIAQNGPTTTQGIMTNGDYSFLTANKHNFYACFTQTHDGPFSAPTLFFDDPANHAQILLDNNYRQSPYVSIVKPVSGKHCKSPKLETEVNRNLNDDESEDASSEEVSG